MSADPRDPPSSTHRLGIHPTDAASIIDGIPALDAERAALTLPGTIPGLLRRGSPVFWRDEQTTYVVAWVGPWPDSDTVDDGAIVLAAPASSPCLGVEDSSGNFALDLTDATGRAHAAWWLGGVGASFHLACDGHRRWELHGGERPRESALRAWEGIGPDARRLRGVPPEYGWDAEDVPALATLDPADPRLLPDGSRWVDAEALRRVCLHVAGLEVTP